MTENKISLYRDSMQPVIVFHNKNERPYVDIPHLHSQYEIYYNINGASGFFADKKLYECTRYDLFIVPAACVHKVLVGKEREYERCIINIDSKVVDAINAAPYMNRPLSWLNGPEGAAPRVAKLKPAEHEAFMAHIEAYNRSVGELERYGRLIEILAFISRYFQPGRETCGIRKQPDSVAEHALILIEENFKTIKISELSERMFVNESYLSGLFKEEYGITLANYLIIRKIAEAKKFLYMGVSVKEACFLSGFHDYSNFIRTFKKFEGHPPGALGKLTDPL